MIARAVSAFVAGLLAAVGLGAMRGLLWLGLCAGLVVGAGLALTVAFTRTGRGRLALPPVTAVAGAIAFALGAVALLRPAALYLPRWIVPLEVKAERAGYRVLGDGASDVDGALAQAMAGYRFAFERLLGVEGALARCPVDVVVTEQRAHAERLQAAAGRMGDFGIVHVPVVGRPVVVVPRGAGWGSVTHHWMYVAAPCALGEPPPWVVVGLAALVEKHLVAYAAGGCGPPDDADELAREHAERGVCGAHFQLALRSDWRPLDVALKSPRRDLARELASARDQTFLRSFFVFLDDEQKLAPLLARVREGEPAEAALTLVMGAPLDEIEARWRAWLHERARRLPTLFAAKPFAGAPDL